MFSNAPYVKIIRLCFISLIIVLTNIGTASFAGPSSATPLQLAGSSAAIALFEQGKSYHDGDGQPVDLNKARALYEQAAALGNIDAKINLGYLYFTGDGVEQDFKKAHAYYLEAANVGDISARKNLGLMYEHGLGVPKNLKTAKTWYSDPIILDRKPIIIPMAPPRPAPANTEFDFTAETIPSSNLLEKGTATQASKPLLKTLSTSFPQTAHIMPKGTANGLATLMLCLAMGSVGYFLVQSEKIKTKKDEFTFIADFVEYHRETLRKNYLRLPEDQRHCREIQEPWAVSLCARIVHFSLHRKETLETPCSASTAILTALEKSPYEARRLAFAYLPFVQYRVLTDIRNARNNVTGIPKPIQFDYEPSKAQRERTLTRPDASFDAAAKFRALVEEAATLH